MITRLVVHSTTIKTHFYKMTGMSSTDGYFDYYFKLKEHLPNVVVKKSNRNNKTEQCI